ncbi:MAG TPA: hypothetical protein EYN66_01720, partial [Myxococcales bacterium]|nr:hypothetical protein [Myxococcales bacterium]
MKIRIGIFSWVFLFVLIAACSDSAESGTAVGVTTDGGVTDAGGDSGADTTSDTGSADGGIGVNTAGGTDETTVDGGDGTTTEGSTDDGTGTGEDPPKDYGELCATYCGKMIECGEISGAGNSACLNECATKLVEDPAWENSYWCAAAVDCKDSPGCLNGAIPSADACLSLCGQAKECDLFPSSLLFPNEGMCVALCSVQLLYQPLNYGKWIDCAKDSLGQKCSDTGLLACSEQLNPKICARICDGGVNEENVSCAQLPLNFESTEQCLTECDSWSPGSRWMADFCQRRFECKPGAEVCFPPPEQVADKSMEACAAAWDLCGGNEEYQLPKDGEFCAWILTGIAMSNSAISFEGSVQCLSDMGECPGKAEIWSCFVEKAPTPTTIKMTKAAMIKCHIP